MPNVESKQNAINIGLLINDSTDDSSEITHGNLIQHVRELAEKENYAHAQYYLANYYLNNNNLEEYKHWLTCAARNANPHPLANLKILIICLQRYHELVKQQHKQAEKYLENARLYLYFIQDYECEEDEQQMDWLYVKQQAELYWRQHFLPETKRVNEVWLTPASNDRVNNTNGLYYLAKQAKILKDKLQTLIKKSN